MKMNWSAILFPALLTLAGCGSEQFGATPQTSTSKAESTQNFQQLSCSSFTLVKPKVDILYVVDNSGSSYYLPNQIKNAIRDTVNTISKQFDYRMIGTGLLPIDGTPFNDYQLMTNSQDPLSTEASGKTVISSNELTFFTTPVGGAETGLRRVIEFINENATNGSGLFRQNAYLLVVVISNGRDVEVESQSPFNNSSQQNVAVYNQRKQSFAAIRDSVLHSQQLRLISVTAGTNACNDGWFSSQLSYIQMSRELYDASGATDSPNKDFYDLCSNGVSSVFAAVNASIQQVVIPHKYKYWPITFTSGDNIDISKIKVFKSTPNSAPVQITSGWQYRANPNYPGTINTRIEPLPEGEPTSARHLIEFSTGNEPIYPECISVTSTTKTEHFGFIVLPQQPKIETIAVRINGALIPQSGTNGWSYVGSKMAQNIKVPYPQNGDQYPAVNKTGFMIQLNGSSNYYKSGDSVEVNYVSAGI